jgi:hypothetical protein
VWEVKEPKTQQAHGAANNEPIVFHSDFQCFVGTSRSFLPRPCCTASPHPG